MTRHLAHEATKVRGVAKSPANIQNGVLFNKV